MHSTEPRIDRRLPIGLGLAALAACGAAVPLRNVALLCVALALAAALTAVVSAKTRGVAVVLSATFCALALAELVAGLLSEDGRNGTRFDERSDYAQRYLRQTDIGSQANPGVHSTRKVDSRGDTIYAVRYTIGSDGFRVTPAAGDTTLSASRINFFGCSFTFGEGLEDEQTLPYFVARQATLRAVKNFGFHGYGAHQALAILTSARDTTGAVNVFLAAPWQATRSACKPEWSAGSPQYSIETGQLRRIGRCRQGSAWARVLNYSKIYGLVRAATGAEQVTDDDFKLYVALVREMARVSATRGQRFVLGFIKADADFFRGTSYDNERLFAELLQTTDDIVDLTLADRAEDLAPRYFINPLDRHPSALANRERAERLISLLNSPLSKSPRGS